MPVTLRFAALEDAAELVEIYRPYVESTAITFEYDVPTVDEFRRRICEYGSEFPFIVAECDGKAVGYAYAHRFAPRYAYRFSAELSVYVDRGFTGMGIGRRLYSALIELMTLLDYRNLYALISCPNPASFALHASFGFKEVGREHGVGYKFGKWIDIATLELTVGEHADTEDEALWRICPMGIGELGDRACEILKKYSETASPIR